MYRPHSDYIMNFSTELYMLLDDHILINKKIISIWDLIINLLPEDSHTVEFSNGMRSFHFLLDIYKPTRFSDQYSDQLCVWESLRLGNWFSVMTYFLWMSDKFEECFSILKKGNVFGIYGLVSNQSIQFCELYLNQNNHLVFWQGS